jgi:hypothetical protein
MDPSASWLTYGEGRPHEEVARALRRDFLFGCAGLVDLVTIDAALSGTAR